MIAKFPRRWLWPAVGGWGALLLLLFVSQAGGQEPLTLTLTAPASCQADYDEREVARNVELRWQVSGGEGPFSVAIDGAAYTGERGLAQAICGIWDEADPSLVDSGLMSFNAQVRDARGEQATAVAYTYAVRVIRADSRPNDYPVGLNAGRTYRVHGMLLTMPEEFGLIVGPYHSAACADPTSAASCQDEFQLRATSWSDQPPYIWLRRWSRDEARRALAPLNEYSAEEVADYFDRLVASIGRPPPPVPGATSIGEDSGDLRIELFAPRICEAYWGRFGGTRQSIPVEWRVSGGAEPYRVEIGGERFEGESGELRTACGRASTDRTGVDSQLMATQANVTDARGSRASGVVNTYVIAAGRFGDDRLRAGWTHRVQGLLMTIPEGLQFDVEYFGSTLVDCEPDEPEEEAEPESARDAGGAVLAQSGLPPADRESDRYRCQNFWSMSGEWLIGGHQGSVWVGFGETTNDVADYGVELDKASVGRAGAEQALQEAERRVWRLAHSVGKPPELPEAGFFNPAPLRIRAWAEPLACGWLYEGHRRRQASAQRRVSGGAWWPLGIGAEAWSSTHRSANLYCPATLGPHQSALATHESGPDPATVEATVTHYAVPVVASGDLSGSGQGWPTSYCRPGGERSIRWSVSGGSGAYRAQVNGADVDVEYHPELGYGDGWAQVRCTDRLGLQAMTVAVWVEAEPGNRLVFPVLLMAVEEHPSGRPWSEFE